MSSGVQGGIGSNALLYTRRDHLAAWGFSWLYLRSYMTQKIAQTLIDINRYFNSRISDLFQQSHQQNRPAAARHCGNPSPETYPEGEAKGEERREALKR